MTRYWQSKRERSSKLGMRAKSGKCVCFISEWVQGWRYLHFYSSKDNHAYQVHSPKRITHLVKTQLYTTSLTELDLHAICTSFTCWGSIVVKTNLTFSWTSSVDLTSAMPSSAFKKGARQMKEETMNYKKHVHRDTIVITIVKTNVIVGPFFEHLNRFVVHSFDVLACFLPPCQPSSCSKGSTGIWKWRQNNNTDERT